MADKSLPNYVEAVFASRWLPPKAAVSAYRRHSFVEGIRNGGLDFVKAAVRLSIGHGDCLLNDGFFSFAVVRQFDNGLFLYLKMIIKSKCHRNVRAALIFGKKQVEMLQNAEISKKYRRKHKYREPGQL